MKKIILFAAAIMMCAASFAQVSSKELLAGAYDFVTKESETWKIWDGKFSEIDLATGQTTFKGSFVVKSIGFLRYDFDCRISLKKDDIKVELANMCSHACNKDGEVAKHSKKIDTLLVAQLQFAEQMKKEIKKRIDEFNFAGILEEKYSACITSPSFLYLYSQTVSELAFKKFIKENVNGKNVELSFKLSSIDENNDIITGKPLPLAYKATGHVYVIKYEDYDEFSVYKDHSILIDVYTNNDALLNAEIGGIYKAKGKLRYEKVSTFWVYNIDEE